MYTCVYSYSYVVLFYVRNQTQRAHYMDSIVTVKRHIVYVFDYNTQAYITHIY